MRRRHDVDLAVGLAVILLATACQKSPSDASAAADMAAATTPATEVRTEPTKDELIDATIRAASAETITRVGHRSVQKRHTCTEMNVATDPYMPNNPELAKCPQVGHSYTTMEDEPYREQVKCPAPPTDHQSWNVTNTGENVWRVSTGGRAWTVTNQAGAATTQTAGNTSVGMAQVLQESGFTLSLVSEGGC